jgi:small subunit ribosomal protein S4e
MGDHQKRLSAPNSWPVERKEQTFTVKAGAGPHGEAGVPLVVLLRDVLGYVDTTKEARYALSRDSVLVNGVPVSDHRRPIGMFDILSFGERDEQFRVFPDEGGRLTLTPISASAADSRLGKVVGKQIVPGGDVQLALHDGATLQLSAQEAAQYNTKDSLVVDNESKEVVAHFRYEEGALVTAVDGTHAGEIGTIEEILVTPGSGANSVRVAQDDGGFETIEEYVVVIDENFTGDSSAEAVEAGEADETGEADEVGATDETDVDVAEADAAGEADETDAADAAGEADETDAAGEADADDGGDDE